MTAPVNTSQVKVTIEHNAPNPQTASCWDRICCCFKTAQPLPPSAVAAKAKPISEMGQTTIARVSRANTAAPKNEIAPQRKLSRPNKPPGVARQKTAAALNTSTATAATPSSAAVAP